MQFSKRCPIPRGREKLFVACALLGALLSAPVHAAPYYEMTAPVRLSTGNTTFGRGVDVATGAFLMRQPLGTIPNRVPIVAEWFYNSQDSTQGPLGKGTSLAYDYFIATSQVIAGQPYELIAPGNRHYAFDATPNGTGDYINSRDPTMLGATLHFTSAPPSLASVLRFKDGKTLTFNSGGALTQVADRFGNALTITRNFQGFITKISQAQYRSLNLVYSPTTGKLTKVTFQFANTSPLNRDWLFGYEPATGRLSTVTDPKGGVTTFTWTTYTRSDGQQLPLVATITNPRNIVALANQYDTAGRITRQTFADSAFLTAGYSAPIGSPGTTTVTDPRSNVSQWTYAWNPSQYGYLVSTTTDALGRQTTYQRNAAPSYLVTGILDFRNRLTSLVWDVARGNLTSVTRPTASGGTATWSATYDTTWSQLTSITDPLSRQTIFTVDAATGNITAIRDAGNHSTSLVYDSVNGDLKSITNPLNKTTQFSYSWKADLLTVKDPLLHQTTLTYDDASRLISTTDANLKTVTLAWDDMDRLTSRSQNVGGQTLTTRWEYDANGNRTALVDAKNQRWEWVHDSRDRVAQEKNPLLQVLTQTWDGNSNLLTRTDRMGQRAEYSYGLGDQLSGIIFRRADNSVESTVTLTYDPATHLLASCTDSQFGTCSWVYDPIDRVTSQSGPNGSVTYTLDDLNRRTGMQVSGQDPISYTYSPTDRIFSISQSGQTTSFQYDAADQPTRRTLPNGASTDWTFDDAGFVTSIISQKGGTAFDSHTYLRDNLGMILQENANGVLCNLGYDDAYRLTSANVGGVGYSWTYDEVGNRLSQTVGGATTNYTYNVANRMTSVNGVTLTYNDNGSLTSDGTNTFYWDLRNRLIGTSRAGLTQEFTYQPDGLRASKTVNGTTTTFVLDGPNCVKETTNGVSVNTLHGPVIDQPISRDGKYFTPNHISSTTTLTDASGNLVQSYQYAPFGQTTGVGSDSNPFQFTGRENDGNGLQYNRERYYAPDLGRYISDGSVGVALDTNLAEGVIVGTNPYVYVGNDPVNEVAPYAASAKLTGFQRFVQTVKLVVQVIYSTTGIGGGTGRQPPPPPPPPPTTITYTGEGPVGRGPGGSGGGSGGSGGSGAAIGAIGTIATGAGVLADGIREVVKYRRRIEEEGFRQNALE